MRLHASIRKYNTYPVPKTSGMVALYRPNGKDFNNSLLPILRYKTMNAIRYAIALKLLTFAVWLIPNPRRVAYAIAFDEAITYCQEHFGTDEY